MCADYDQENRVINIPKDPRIDRSLPSSGLADASSVLTTAASGTRIELDESGESFLGPYLELV